MPKIALIFSNKVIKLAAALSIPATPVYLRRLGLRHRSRVVALIYCCNFL